MRPKEWPSKLKYGKRGLKAFASIKDFQGGTNGYVADAVEQALLLPEDMAELQSIRRHEVFFSLKRYLAMVTLLLDPFFFSFSLIPIIALLTFLF